MDGGEANLINHDVLKEKLNNEIENNKNLHIKLNGNLEKIWEALDNIKEQIDRRPPLWASAIITLLTALTTGLIVARF